MRRLCVLLLLAGCADEAGMAAGAGAVGDEIRRQEMARQVQALRLQQARQWQPVLVQPLPRPMSWR